MQWKAPKSVRQIGNTKGKTKIYMEDYVINFGRRLAKESEGNEVAGVLLGHRFFHAGEKVFLVSGMVSISQFYKRPSDIFTQDMWTGIYTDIKENFTNLDIVGWYYSKGSEGTTEVKELLELHRRNFSEGDKLLYVYEGKSQENTFYLYENVEFRKQNGYYIYYEKNPEMRRYMMEEANRLIHIVEQEDDRVLRNIRGVLQENEERKKEQQAEGRWGMGLAGVVVTLGLALAVVAINNQNGLADLKTQMKGMQSVMTEETAIETVGGGVVSEQAVGTSNVVESGASTAPIN